MNRRSALVALATAFTLALSGPVFAQAKSSRPQIAVLDVHADHQPALSVLA